MNSIEKIKFSIKADIKIDSFFYGVEETTQIEISKVN